MKKQASVILYLQRAFGTQTQSEFEIRGVFLSFPLVQKLRLMLRSNDTYLFRRPALITDLSWIQCNYLKRLESSGIADENINKSEMYVF
jgi:hypothetical protein